MKAVRNLTETTLVDIASRIPKSAVSLHIKYLINGMKKIILLTNQIHVDVLVFLGT